VLHRPNLKSFSGKRSVIPQTSSKLSEIKKQLNIGYDWSLLALGCFGIEEEVNHAIYWLLEFILTLLNKKKARKRRSSAC